MHAMADESVYIQNIKVDRPYPSKPIRTILDRAPKAAITAVLRVAGRCEFVMMMMVVLVDAGRRWPHDGPAGGEEMRPLMAGWKMSAKMMQVIVRLKNEH